MSPRLSSLRHCLRRPRPRIRCPTWALGFSLLVVGCGGPSTPQDTVSAADHVPDTLALLDLRVATGVLDSVMAAEEKRLELACTSGGPACRHAHDPSRVVPLDIVRALPSARAPAVGILAAHVHVPDDGGLSADLVFVGTTSGGTAPPTHLRSLGDWGYGISFAVRHWTAVLRPDRDPRLWARIPGAGSAGGGWLALGRGGLQGSVSPADELVWKLDADARAGAGVPFDHVRILGIEDGWVTMRAEVPSDMPCGVETAPDPEDPAVTRLRLSGLFTAGGVPRIRTAYPRGC